MKTYRNICRGLFACVCSILLFASCGSVGSVAGGLNDESYIVLSANRQYVGSKVLVMIDGGSGVEVRVRKDGANAVRRGSRLVVQPGRHQVQVVDEMGKVLFDKEVFVSTRSERKIDLP